MIELLWARLAATGASLSDYLTALEYFFTYIVKSGLKKRVFFTDYYSTTCLPAGNTGVIEIFDPVNPDNNVAWNYNETHRQTIVKAAREALDAIRKAKCATTKTSAVECLQEVLGRDFKG